METKEYKMNMDLDILNFAKKLKVAPGTKASDGLLYVRCDSVMNSLGVVIEGNLALIAEGIGQYMDGDIGAKDFFLSVVGSYLSHNPETYEQFKVGVKMLQENIKKG